MKMSINCDEPSSLLLTPPPEYCCVNCSSPGTVSEIHIYSPADVFERSVTILDSLCEIFASPPLQLAQNGNFTVTMCAKCAESLSYIYQSFMNLLSLSTASCYLTKLLAQVDNWHFQKTTTHVQDETYNIFNIEINPAESSEVEFTPHVIEINEEKQIHVGTGKGEGDIETEIDKEQERIVLNNEILVTTPMPEPAIIDTTSYEVIAAFPVPQHDSLVDRQSRIKGKYVSRNVTKRRYFRCNQCPAEFIPIFELHEHIMSSHESKIKTKCDKCPFTYFPEIIKFETHSCMDSRERNTVKKSRPFLCGICGARFGGERLLTFHKERVHTQEDIRYKCHYCDKQVVDRHKLFMHVEIHASTKAYLCFDCGKSFSQKRGLDKHLEIHFLDRDTRLQERHAKDVGSFPCNICNKIFSYKRNLKEHQKMHIPETNKYRCPICEKPHWARKRLEKHIMLHNPILKNMEVGGSGIHSTEKRKQSRRKAISLKCSNCSKEFKCQQDLTEHQQFTHFNSHQCDLCGKSVSGRRNLEVHLRTHMNLEEKFRSRNEVNATHRCQFCPKVYSSLQDLELHNVVHGSTSDDMRHPVSPLRRPYPEGGYPEKVTSVYRNSKKEEPESILPTLKEGWSSLRSPKRRQRSDKGRRRNTASSRSRMLLDSETSGEAALDVAVANFENVEGKRAIILIDRIRRV